MGISILVNRRKPQKIGNIELDATIRENHDFRNVVTSYPIEEGFDIGDHVRPQPENITIDGFITNTPPELLGGRSGEFLFREDNSNRVQLAFNELLNISGRRVADVKEGTTVQFKKAEIIDLVTILQVYNNMVIVNLRFPVDRAGGQAQRFTATFKRLDKVQSDITVIENISDMNGAAQNAENQGAKTSNKGKQDTKEIKQQSLLSKISTAMENKLKVRPK